MVSRYFIAAALILLAGTAVAQTHDAPEGGAPAPAASPAEQEKRVSHEQGRPVKKVIPREQKKQMTPEERRQLRNDVNSAGRQIYGRPARTQTEP